MRLKTKLLVSLLIMLSSAYLSAEDTKPDRQTIDSTVAKIDAHWSTGDMQSWVYLFTADGEFLNSALTQPVIGPAAIKQLASQWPKVENIREWRVIEGERMAIGWRERAMRKDGQMGAWYRGMSTFVFDADGRIKSYEGIFNLEAMKAAYAD